jgi:thiosulfate reductase cytochrome b subunit
MLNAIFMLLLIITGLSMQYAGPDGGPITFQVSVRIHNVSGIGLTISYLLFIIGNMISGNGKHYRLQWRGLRNRMMTQLRYYLSGYFKKNSPPFPVSAERKFNPLQAFSYVLSMYVGIPLLVISGWGLLFPETIIDRIFGASGLILTDLLHVIMGFLLSIFLILHVYLCTIGMDPKQNFRAILTGWHHSTE